MSWAEIEQWAKTLAEHPDIEECVQKKVARGMTEEEARKKCEEETGE